MKVFWSWQSDHEGKVSHFLVLDALQIAIEKLKLPSDIEEPLETDRRANLELDHDIKNETGWADIADTIFKKIDACSVVVADVTPVATSSSKKKNGKEVGFRPVMNPNVAIELGYALRARGWSNCIGVLNLAYGEIESLPFDINRNRSWPVTYTLAEDAPNSEINAVRKRLADDFYLRLLPFLSKIQRTPEEEFVRMPAKRPPAFWFEKDESLGRRGDDAEFWMPFESVVFVRLIPTDPSQRLISHELAGQAASKYGSFEIFGDLYILRNDDGAAMCELDGQKKNVTSIAQYFNSGEIWGINATIPRLAERGKLQYLLMDEIEKLFRTQVPRFLECMTRELRVSPPIRLIGGVAGIKGRSIAWSGGPGNGYSKMRLFVEKGG
jgi:hypothetical protein